MFFKFTSLLLPNGKEVDGDTVQGSIFAIIFANDHCGICDYLSRYTKELKLECPDITLVLVCMDTATYELGDKFSADYVIEGGNPLQNELAITYNIKHCPTVVIVNGITGDVISPNAEIDIKVKTPEELRSTWMLHFSLAEQNEEDISFPSTELPIAERARADDEMTLDGLNEIMEEHERSRRSIISSEGMDYQVEEPETDNETEQRGSMEHEEDIQLPPRKQERTMEINTENTTAVQNLHYGNINIKNEIIDAERPRIEPPESNHNNIVALSPVNRPFYPPNPYWNQQSSFNRPTFLPRPDQPHFYGNQGYYHPPPPPPMQPPHDPYAYNNAFFQPNYQHPIHHPPITNYHNNSYNTPGHESYGQPYGNYGYWQPHPPPTPTVHVASSPSVLSAAPSDPLSLQDSYVPQFEHL